MGQDFILHTIGKEGVVGIAAQVFERQHGDALFGDRHDRARWSPQKEEEASDNRGKHEQRDGRFRPADVRAMPLNRLKLLGKL